MKGKNDGRINSPKGKKQRKRKSTIILTRKKVLATKCEYKYTWNDRRYFTSTAECIIGMVLRVTSPRALWHLGINFRSAARGLGHHRYM